MFALRVLLMALMALIVSSFISVTHSYSVGQTKFGPIKMFPYQVMLIGKQMWRKRILCGGTLLDNRSILTAGHCTMGVTHFDVYLGTRSIEDSLESGKLILRSNKFIVHERFNAVTAANDIALVKLPEDVQFTLSVRSATLPYHLRGEKFIGSRVVATGWGAIPCNTPN